MGAPSSGIERVTERYASGMFASSSGEFAVMGLEVPRREHQFFWHLRIGTVDD
jgi:hypothetical protein